MKDEKDAGRRRPRRSRGQAGRFSIGAEVVEPMGGIIDVEISGRVPGRDKKTLEVFCAPRSLGHDGAEGRWRGAIGLTAYPGVR
jgi:hypothetical protein